MNNNNFLRHVATDLIGKYGCNLSKTVVVFPNKRASLFLNEQLMAIVERPLWSPRYITISELFCQQSNLQMADPLKLIGRLHRVYQQCVGSNESLDSFFGWGRLLLADFDDVDKNMADANKVFANVTNLHEFDDDTYLTEQQREILKQFFGNFTDGHTSQLKERFLKFWSHLYDIYTMFRQQLRSESMGYEGMIYRDVAEKEIIDLPHERYIFVGFNMLHKVEQHLFERLQKEGKARFYWDFDDYYMHGNEAGHFIAQYLQHFPNELANSDPSVYNCMRQPKEIAIMSAQTNDLQARYVAQWLNNCHRLEDGNRTAIVLCDETLLPTVIHCLPDIDDMASRNGASDETTSYNITTGFPLSKSPIASLVTHLINLQTTGRSGDTFRMKYVQRVLNHPYAEFISPECSTLIEVFKQQITYYLAPTDKILTENIIEEEKEVICTLFSPLKKDETFHTSLLRWLATLLRTIGGNIVKTLDDHSPLLQESVYRMYTLVNRLYALTESGDICVDTPMLGRLLNQLIQATTIPFHGEPAVGVQVMGMLETRNIDFDHLLILSCNEGNLPKGINDASFIPYSIRKAYDLTTVDHKVDIYAYYFYRLLQRAKDVTILFNAATDDGQRGEMSRFMLQLMVEYPHPVNRYILEAGQHALTHQVDFIAKTPAIMLKLNSLEKLSPTAINRYLRCQLIFYYNVIQGLKEPQEEDGDVIDNRLFGTIFHRACELVYIRLASASQLTNTAPAPSDFPPPGKQGYQKGVAKEEVTKLGAPLEVRKEDIESLLRNPATIEAVVDQAISEELFNNTSNHKLNGLQIIKREVIISYLTQLLQLDKKIAPFTIIGLEQSITLEGKEGMPPISGYIDRLDLVTGEDGKPSVRVIDYKTGRQPNYHPNSVEETFDPAFVTTRHSDYYLQAMLYALAVSRDAPWHMIAGLPVAPALLFIQHTASGDYDPVLQFGKEPINDISRHADEIRHHLKALLTEIYDPTIPFSPTTDAKRCAICPYRKICGR